MNTTDDQNPYQATFIAYVISGVQEALERVRTAEPLPDEHDRQFAWHILSYAFNFAEAWPCTRELLLALAPKMEQAGFREEWLAYLQEGHRQAQVQQDALATAECELQMGLLYRLLSRFAEAYQWTSVSVKHFALFGNAQGQARALNELAWLAHLQHHYTEASQHVEEALTLLNDEDPERAMCYRVLGMVAIDQERWQAAEDFHRKALVLFEHQGNQRKIAWGMQNLAFALRGQKRFKEAIIYYQLSAAILDEIADIHNWSIVQLNRGLANYYSGEFEEALRCFANAEMLFRKLNDELQLARISTNLGLAYMATHMYSKAEKAFLEASTLFQSLRDESWRLNAIDGLVMTYLASGQYNLASEVAERALNELPNIINAPNYPYLLNSFSNHLAEVRQRQGLN